MWNLAFYLIIATFVVLLRFGTFIVFEGSQVIITQFGAIVGTPYDEPGLYFRLPLIQRTHYFDSRIQTWEGYQNYVPTRDKLYIGVETVAHWRIVDPGLYLETLGNDEAARSRLDSIMNGAVKDSVAAHALVDTVRSTNNVVVSRGKAEKIADADLTDGMATQAEDDILKDLESVTVGRLHLSNKMLQIAAAGAEPLGIEVVNVFIKKISYHPPVERMVYERMISERNRVAERLRSIGRSESERIRGETAQHVQEIVAPAERQAEMIKGRADAQATKLYAETFGQDPDFYRFWRTLAAYRDALPENAEIIGSLDSNFFSMMRERSQFLTPPVLSAEQEAALATAGGDPDDPMEQAVDEIMEGLNESIRIPLRMADAEAGTESAAGEGGGDAIGAEGAEAGAEPAAHEAPGEHPAATERARDRDAVEAESATRPTAHGEGGHGQEEQRPEAHVPAAHRPAARGEANGAAANESGESADDNLSAAALLEDAADEVMEFFSPEHAAGAGEMAEPGGESTDPARLNGESGTRRRGEHQDGAEAGEAAP